MFLHLKRNYFHDITLSYIYHESKLKFVGLELPYKNNFQNISCIPEGVYNIERHSSEKHPNTFILLNKTLKIGRSEEDTRNYILIHRGNSIVSLDGTLLLGCIIIGKKFGIHNNQWAVLETDQAMKELNEIKLLDDSRIVIDSFNLGNLKQV